MHVAAKIINLNGIEFGDKLWLASHAYLSLE